MGCVPILFQDQSFIFPFIRIYPYAHLTPRFRRNRAITHRTKELNQNLINTQKLNSKETLPYCQLQTLC